MRTSQKLAVVIIILFFWGLLAFYKHIFPYHQLQWLGNLYFPQSLSKDARELAEDLLLVESAFADPLNSRDTIHAVIASVKDLLKRNEEIFVPLKGFDQAYKNIKILEVQQVKRSPGQTPIVKVNFHYQGKKYDAFAYGIRPQTCPIEKTSGLIIPGSGHNQSLKIALYDQKNYHYGIQDPLKKFSVDTFILIKPNEDDLAWHNGTNKISADYIWDWHIIRGGSYSASYLIQSLAIQKFLNSCYDKTLVAGLSEGGVATLLNAIQSEPTVAIVAAGSRFIGDYAEWPSHDRLYDVTAVSSLYTEQQLADVLKKSKTKWLFTWGQRKIGDYRIVPQDRVAAYAIEPLYNVSTNIHAKGNAFESKAIINFLKVHLSSGWNGQ